MQVYVFYGRPGGKPHIVADIVSAGFVGVIKYIQKVVCQLIQAGGLFPRKLPNILYVFSGEDKQMARVIRIKVETDHEYTVMIDRQLGRGRVFFDKSAENAAALFYADIRQFIKIEKVSPAQLLFRFLKQFARRHFQQILA